MRCKIGVLSVGLLKQSLSDEIDAMNLPADFLYSDTMLTDDMELPREVRNADVFLSSGQLAKILRAKTDRPIITIEPSIYDILLAYSTAVSYDSKPVIIFPLKRSTPMIDHIRNILAFDIISSWYDEVDAIDRMISSYKARGCKCIIGSGLVCEKAQAAGLKSIFLYPKESLRSFIKLAYDMGVSICEKAAENQRMASVISHSHSGIIFTDETGIISICNPIAQQILFQKGKSVVGTKIFELLNEKALQNVYEKKEPVNHLICSLGEVTCILSAVPILRRGNLCNVMLTIDNIKSIQNQEYHIRSSLAQRGFSAHKYFKDYNSNSPLFNQMIETAKKFAQSNDNIIILGETGTGKEVLAQSIHNYSPRAKRPFVAVNCSAISEALLESELFGYDEGAFTGAKKGGKQGYFEMAHTGTIFLDEISELSMSLQSKLLRVIQEMQVIHVGGSRVIDLDIRIIAATNQDLWILVQQKKFREDLYYRLNVLELNLPPLRDRVEDIYPLFLNFVSKQSPSIVMHLNMISKQLIQALCSYSWPGNIRELENFSKIICVTCDLTQPNEEIYLQIAKELEKRRRRLMVQSPLENGESVFMPKTVKLTETEEDRIRKALATTDGNYTRAAELLGISRVTLWRKIKLFQGV
ncbi:sigma 54-interacting transcriptional regulator [Marasmitruncus massiliensis]|uniref:sigma 54-interacting transcriptional regulator n=1 Tax=Marasmitruncus massiliensis TaxID=1944642 RepID=UPI000C7D4474|nr:sigma 54-interacting transcriptional regulator [Marasmitruncus massiliensis]